MPVVAKVAGETGGHAGGRAMGEANSSQGQNALTSAALGPRNHARLREWFAGGVLAATWPSSVAKLLERSQPWLWISRRLRGGRNDRRPSRFVRRRRAVQTAVRLA